MKVKFDYGNDDIFEDFSSDNDQTINVNKQSQKAQEQNNDVYTNQIQDNIAKTHINHSDLDYLLPQTDAKNQKYLQENKKQSVTVKTKQKSAQIIQEEKQVKKKLRDIYERRNKKIEKIQKQYEATSSYQVIKQSTKFFSLKKFQSIFNDYFFVSGTKYSQFHSITDQQNLEVEFNKMSLDEKFDYLVKLVFEKENSKEQDVLKYFLYLLKQVKIEYKIIYFLKIENLGYQKRFKMNIPKTFKINEKDISKKFRYSKKSHQLRKKICQILNDHGMYILIGEDAQKYRIPLFNGAYIDIVGRNEQKQIKHITKYSQDKNFEVLNFEQSSDNKIQRNHGNYFCYNILPYILKKMRKKIIFGVFLFEQNKQKLQVSQITRLVLPEVIWSQIYMNQMTMKMNEFLDMVCQNNENLPVYLQKIDTQLQKLRQPQSNFEFKVSDTYVVKNALFNNQFLKEGAKPAPFTFKGQKVFYKKDIMELQTEFGWKKQGRIVIEGEQPTKSVPSEYSKKGFCNYYKRQQTKEYVLEIIDGQLPANEYGNIELYACQLPDELVHLKEKGMWRVCKRLKIDYRKAITGFDKKKGRNVVVADGIVVFKKFQDKLLKEWEIMQEEIQQKEQIKNEKKVLELWRKLIKTILVKRYFKSNKPNY